MRVYPWYPTYDLIYGSAILLLQFSSPSLYSASCIISIHVSCGAKFSGCVYSHTNLIDPWQEFPPHSAHGSNVFHWFCFEKYWAFFLTLSNLSAKLSQYYTELRLFFFFQTETVRRWIWKTDIENHGGRYLGQRGFPFMFLEVAFENWTSLGHV